MLRNLQSLLTRMRVWAYALGFLSLIGTILGHEFYYSKSAYQKSDECHLCFANDCLALERAHCEYYAETDKIIHRVHHDHKEDDTDPRRNEVDSLIYDLVEKATNADHLDCIPYVSRYTDCNKENACLGCNTCSCNSTGKWNCSVSQPCRSQNAFNIDHRVLIAVLETLTDTANTKKTKRSITIPDSYTLEEMSQWLFGAKPLANVSLNSDDTTITVIEAEAGTNNTTFGPTITTTTTTEGILDSEPVTGLTTTETSKTTTDTTINIDSDNVAFDEVLRSIAVDTKGDTKGNTRRKQPLQNELNNKTFSIDYMLMDEDNETMDSNDDLYLVDFMQNDNAVTEIPTGVEPKIIIDLLETANQVGDSHKTRDNGFFNKNLDKDLGNADDTDDIIEYNAINIMKRDVSDVIALDSVPTVSFVVNNNKANITEEQLDLKENVLTPLNKIINDKKKDLDDLNKVKNNLLKHMSNKEEQHVKEARINNNLSSTYFSIYNFALDQPEPDTNARRFEDLNLRRDNLNDLDSRVNKLKSDMLEVVKDILEIRKNKNSVLPEDLKVLMHAMKHYVYNDKAKEGRTIINKKLQKIFARRRMQQNRCDYISYKDCIVQIINVIDKVLPESNALCPLSPATRKIMRYVINTFHVDDFAVIRQRVNNPNHNLTNDLKSVGNKWHDLTVKLIGNTPTITLYRMKLLHYVLTTDINKMAEVLSVVYFSHSRRMLHTLDTVNIDIINKIDSGLREIHKKIQIIIQYYAKVTDSPITIRLRAETDPTTTTTDAEIDTRIKKKRSFIQHIRSLLKSSKNDIAELLHRKVPKSEIVKQLARKKLDELSEKRYNEYEDTMKRWQKNLEITPRIKRGLFKNFKNRIKNIIPGYLRHKVSPKIHQKKKNENNRKNNNDLRMTTPKKKLNVHPTPKTTGKKSTKSLRSTTKRNKSIKYTKSTTLMNMKP